MNTVALATTALAQGPSFWHAGTDLLRSKSLDRNSFNSGDWFNRIDWSCDESTWGSGLPPRGDNETKWDVHAAAARGPGARAAPGRHPRRPRPRRRAAAHPLSSPLFRLGSAPRSSAGWGSRWAGRPDPGVIVMVIDTVGGIVVVFNASREATTQTIPALGTAATRCTRCRRAAAIRSSRARARRGARSPCRPGRWRCSSVVLGDEERGGEPALGESPRPLGLAVEEPHADGEDLVKRRPRSRPSRATRNPVPPAT